MFFFPVKYWCWFNLYLTNYYLLFHLVSHLAVIIQFILQPIFCFWFWFLRNKIPLWGQSIESQNYLYILWKPKMLWQLSTDYVGLSILCVKELILACDLFLNSLSGKTLLWSQLFIVTIGPNFRKTLDYDFHTCAPKSSNQNILFIW